MARQTKNNPVKIGGWPLEQYARLTQAWALLAGAAGVVLIAFKVKPIFLWVLVIGLFIVLSIRIVFRRGRALHLFTAGWLVGLPVGFAFALAELFSYRDPGVVVDLVRLPLLVTFIGVLIGNAMGYALTRHVTVKHLFFSDPNPPKRKLA